MSRPASVCEAPMLLDYILGGLVAVFLLGYLVYALARPERF
jgi:K+-transporting ATPase KdpF subunit